VKTRRDPLFGFDVVTECLGVRDTWVDKAAYDATAKKLAGLFIENFRNARAALACRSRGHCPSCKRPVAQKNRPLQLRVRARHRQTGYRQMEMAY
jgi:hypothetical protein